MFDRVKTDTLKFQLYTISVTWLQNIYKLWEDKCMLLLKERVRELHMKYLSQLFLTYSIHFYILQCVCLLSSPCMRLLASNVNDSKHKDKSNHVSSWFNPRRNISFTMNSSSHVIYFHIKFREIFIFRSTIRI